MGDPAPPGGSGGSGAFEPGHERPSRFPPIADYGFLSDRENMALVASSGEVEWLCLPRPDSPSVFATMLDRAAGRFRVGPADQRVPAARRYVPGTNVLETSWQTRTGWLVVRDALAIGRWSEDEHRDPNHPRPPSDHRAERVLLRTVECVNGSVEVEVTCHPVFDYGRTPGRWEYEGEGYGHLVAKGGDDDPVLRLTTDLRLGIEEGSAVAFRHLEQGESAYVALSWTDDLPAPMTVQDAHGRVQETSDYWRDWLDQGEFPDHPWRSHLQRSALVLKGLQYRPTGALLAAATTSLPETPGGERNWDYRYTWVRDSTFALWSLHTLGFASEAREFLAFIMDRIQDGSRLQIMYGVGGETTLEEHTLDHLTGYEHSRPVRIGNGAYDQHQHDVWGAALDAVWLHVRAAEELGRGDGEFLRRPVESAIAGWADPDQGIWEVRGTPQHFTSSKIMCWVACDRGARLAELMEMTEEAARWRQQADMIHQDVMAKGVDTRGVLTQSYGSTALDASNLLAILMRFLPPDHPVARATVLAIADELTKDGLVLRYRTDETDDGLSGEEGTFAICSFWLVSALCEIGELGRARILCEKLLSFASPLGLYAEEIDAASGRLLGNFPQAFTHLALINAVIHVIRAERDGQGLALPD